MMRKVQINEAGDTRFLESQIVDKNALQKRTTASGVRKSLWTKAILKQ